MMPPPFMLPLGPPGSMPPPPPLLPFGGLPDAAPGSNVSRAQNRRGQGKDGKKEAVLIDVIDDAEPDAKLPKAASRDGSPAAEETSQPKESAAPVVMGRSLQD